MSSDLNPSTSGREKRRYKTSLSTQKGEETQRTEGEESCLKGIIVLKKRKAKCP